MTFIKPDPLTGEKKCFFCNGGLEFLLNETMKEPGMHFRCVPCKIEYLAIRDITSYPMTTTIAQKDIPIVVEH